MCVFDRLVLFLVLHSSLLWNIHVGSVLEESKIEQIRWSNQLSKELCFIFVLSDLVPVSLS